MHLSPLQERIDVWEKELADDEDKIFLMQGLKNGFSIVDEDKISSIQPSFTDNSFSMLRAAL